MKVLLFNGSANEKGCTYTALSEVAGALEKEGIETEIVQLGKACFHTCTGCGYCGTQSPGRCVFDDDPVNAILEKAEAADAYIFGSPVHFAAASGAITTFLSRFFYAGGQMHAYKPGGVVLSCRRGGATAAWEQLNKYFGIRSMPIVSSQYWNMVHGNTPDEVKQDLEGMQTMRTLGRNMAWMLKSLEAGKAAGIERPKPEKGVQTNFIR
ncbi:MAG: flavodoxin family protein [Clostridia bacterium]|nr:flavodoxin family protein [Clostridia bacterium]